MRFICLLGLERHLFLSRMSRKRCRTVLHVLQEIKSLGRWRWINKVSFTRRWPDGGSPEGAAQPAAAGSDNKINLLTTTHGNSAGRRCRCNERILQGAAGPLRTQQPAAGATCRTAFARFSWLRMEAPCGRKRKDAVTCDGTALRPHAAVYQPRLHLGFR